MKKIPVLALNLTAEQEAKITNCSNSVCFEIVHEADPIESDFIVVVNGVDVSVDFLNLMLWGKNLYENDEQCIFIDSYTPINEQLPKKAADKVFIRPKFFGQAYGMWNKKGYSIVKTPAEVELVQKIMDEAGQFVVAPFVSRITDGVSDKAWIDNGYYKPVSKNGFHFNG